MSELLHTVTLERYREPCFDCTGHSRAKAVCSCGWEVALHEIGIGYDVDFELKALGHRVTMLESVA